MPRSDEDAHFCITLPPAGGSGKRHGLSRRAYLVRLLEETPVHARSSQEIKELRTRTRRIGTGSTGSLAASTPASPEPEAPDGAVPAGSGP